MRDPLFFVKLPLSRRSLFLSPPNQDADIFFTCSSSPIRDRSKLGEDSSANLFPGFLILFPPRDGLPRRSFSRSSRGCRIVPSRNSRRACRYPFFFPTPHLYSVSSRSPHFVRRDDFLIGFVPGEQARLSPSPRLKSSCFFSMEELWFKALCVSIPIPLESPFL